MRRGGFGRPLWPGYYPTIRRARTFFIGSAGCGRRIDPQSSAAFERAGCRRSFDIGRKTVNRARHRGTGIERRRGLRWLQLPPALAGAASVPARPATPRTNRALARLPSRTAQFAWLNPPLAGALMHHSRKLWSIGKTYGVQGGRCAFPAGASPYMPAGASAWGGHGISENSHHRRALRLPRRSSAVHPDQAIRPTRRQPSITNATDA
jgi:hypothetical protein